MNPPSEPAYTAAQKRAVVLLAGMLPVAIAVGGVGWALSWLHELPDPVAIHWSGSGPDGFGEAALGLWLLVGIVLAFAAFSTGVVVRSRAATVSSGTARFLVAVSGWFSILLTTLIVGSLAAQRGLEDARDAPEVNTLLGVAFLIATVIAVGLWFLAPRAREIEPEQVAEAEPLPLIAGERVHWSGEARPARIVVGIAGIALVVTAVSGVVLILIGTPGGWVLPLVLFLVLLLAASTLAFRVSIDARGVRIRSVLGLPRFDIPMETVTGVRAVPVDALAEFGGWGLRIGRGGRLGIVLNSRGALEISRATRPALVVTVDDAATAASVLAGLVARRDAGAPAERGSDE